jgi:hypothetical protein
MWQVYTRPTSASDFFLQKNNMAASIDFLIPVTILDFLQNCVSTKFASLIKPNTCKKKIEEVFDTLKVKLKNRILIRHFGSRHHFWLI